MINIHERIRIIDNFLPEEQAYKAYGLIDQLPANWFLTKKSYIDHEGTRVTSNDWWNIHGDRFKNPPLDINQEITYQFLATEEHQDNCNCVYCETITYIKDNPSPDVGEDIITQHLLSVYRPGDYLSQHTDEEGATWAFTYTLSAGWRPEWGGLLHIQDPDDGEWYAFPPTFNRLILMDLTQGPPLNHFVSKVTDDALQNRITISGWYNNVNPNMVDVDHEDVSENVTETVLDYDPVSESVNGTFTFREFDDAEKPPTASAFGGDLVHEEIITNPDGTEYAELDVVFTSVEEMDKDKGFD